MGLLNWVFKGVNVEKRQPKTRSADAVMELPQLSTDFDPQLQQQPIVQSARSHDLGRKDFAGNAASILFENTERQLAPSFGYETSPFGSGSQYGMSNSSIGGGLSNGFGVSASALGGSMHGNRNILVVTPSTNVEVTEVMANLRNGDACIVCLEGMDITDAQRRLDYLSGAISAMGGKIKRLNANTYILTPSGIGVRNQNHH